MLKLIQILFLPFKTGGRNKIREQLKFRPYPGYQNKLVPTQIKSGDMTNIAPSASKIITAEIAGPKLDVKAEVRYPATVRIPTFKGMKKEFLNVSAYDKETGRIVHDKVLVNRPNYVMETSVMEIKHPHHEIVDLKTGDRLNVPKEKTTHGISDQPAIPEQPAQPVQPLQSDVIVLPIPTPSQSDVIILPMPAPIVKPAEPTIQKPSHFQFQLREQLSLCPILRQLKNKKNHR